MKKLKNILLMSLLLNSNQKATEPDYKIKLYSFYTPSHQILKEKWFVPTIQDDFELVIDFYEQDDCPTGEFLSEGWQKMMLRKVDLVLRAIKENWGKIFIYADIDIQFFRPMKDFIVHALEDKDMVIQRNDPTGHLCAGFFACRANERTLNLYQSIRTFMIKTNCKSDQVSLNNFLRVSNPHNVIWDYLPLEFFAPGAPLGQQWKQHRNPYLPKNIVLHHANFTKGIEKKLKQLQQVRERNEMQKSSSADVKIKKFN